MTVTGEPVLDTCYHLLRLYCSRDYSLETTLDPAASTPYLLDFRLRLVVFHVKLRGEFVCVCVGGGII